MITPLIKKKTTFTYPFAQGEISIILSLSQLNKQKLLINESFDKRQSCCKSDFFEGTKKYINIYKKCLISLPSCFPSPFEPI